MANQGTLGAKLALAKSNAAALRWGGEGSVADERWVAMNVVRCLRESKKHMSQKNSWVDLW